MMIFKKQPLIAVFAGVWVMAPVVHAGDLFAYPPAGRNEVQQQQDQFECHQWAVGQSKFDPVQVAAQGSGTVTAPAQPPAGHQSNTGGAVVSGAAQGALVGEVSKGDAGKGAAAGATLGLLRSRMAEHQAVEQRAAVQAQAAQRTRQQESQQAAELQVKKGAYQRARGTCFRARGYTVSES